MLSDPLLVISIRNSNAFLVEYSNFWLKVFDPVNICVISGHDIFDNLNKMSKRSTATPH